MMNTILSILVCFAMLCSGTTALPAQPETAVTWTLRNVTLDCDGESVTLAPEARITTALGAEKAQLHFELGNGEDVLMPVSGEITPDCARFTLGHGEQAYTVTEETLTAMLDLDAEDALYIDLAVGVITDYCALLNRTYADAEFAQTVSDAAMQAMIDACGAKAEETEVEIDGESYPAQLYNLDMDLKDVLVMLDNLRACGVAEFETLMEDLAEICALALDGEMEFTNFADLAAEMDDMEFSYPMVLTIMQQGDLAYSSMAYSASIDGEEFMEMNLEAVARGEEYRMSAAVAAGMGEQSVAYDVNMDMTGPYNAPEMMNMNVTMSIVGESSYSYEEEGDGEAEAVEHICQSLDATTMVMDVNLQTVDGLRDVETTMNMSNNYASYTDGEEDYAIETAVLMECASDAFAEADGSVTSSVSLKLDADGESYALSFDLNRAEAAAVDYFDGLKTCELTGDLDEENPAFAMLTSDAMAFAADAMQLAADDSVIALMQALGMDAVETDGGDSYEPTESYVSGFEEAAGIFGGTIPAFDAPEGFTLDGVEVDEYSLTANYSCEAGSFSMSAYAYGAEGLEYFALRDGALEPAERVVELCSYDSESVDSATVYGPEGTLYFYFDLEDASREAVEAILAGLNG